MNGRIIEREGSSPLKILTTGDNHLGKRQYKSNTRRQDYMDSFREVIDIAIEQNVDAVVNKGDLFDDPEPNVQTVMNCTEEIGRLEDHDIPFLAIVGNHERKQSTQWVDLIGKLSNIYRLSQEPTILHNDSYGICIYGIDAIRKYEWESMDLSLTTPEPEFSDYPRFTVMHELISPPIQEGIHDYEAEVILNRFDMEIDLLGLSDYHEPIEAVVNEIPIYYSGATEKTKYNEPDTHSVVILTVAKDISKERVKLTESRPFKVLSINFEETTTFADIIPELDSISLHTDEKNPVVVVKLSGVDTGVPTNRIRDYLSENGAEIVKVYDNRGDSEVDIDELSLETDIHGLEGAIDKSLGDLELSAETVQINEKVRDLEVPKTHIRSQTKDLVEEGDTDAN